MSFLTELFFENRFLTSVFAFLLVIGPAVFIHELGHFLVAKKFGVKVYTFSLGFGPRIWSKEWRGTEYAICWIPLGGYVKMAGEDPSEERAGTPDEFAAKPVWQRALVILAGPAANLLLGFLLCIWIYAAGLERADFLPRVGAIGENSPVAEKLEVGDEIVAVDGEPVENWFQIEDRIRKATGKDLQLTVKRDGVVTDVTVQPVAIKYPDDLPLIERGQAKMEGKILGNGTLYLRSWIAPVVGDLREDGSAEEAGIKPGDKIVAIGDSAVAQWGEIGRIIRGSGGDTQSMTILREGETLTLAMIPKREILQRPDGSIDSYLAVGISPVMKDDPRGPAYAVGSAVFMTARMSRLIVVTLKGLIQGEISPKLLAGPVGIAQGSGASFREGGIAQLIHFLALISINLGVVNLFPIPLLDGGWLFIFLTYEAIMRKPMPQKFQERVMQVGIVLLLSLIVFITFNDLGRVFGFQSVEDVIAEKDAP